MVELNESGIGLLASVSGVDMKTAAKTDLLNVPPGKTAYVTMVVVREPSASMAGGTDYDFGTGVNADTWRQTIDLSSMTTPGTDYMAIRGADVTKYTDSAEATAFGIKVITGTSAACTATIDTFGFLA